MKLSGLVDSFKFLVKIKPEVKTGPDTVAGQEGKVRLIKNIF